MSKETTKGEASLIPEPLIYRVKKQEAILFLGAGASIGAKHPNGNKIPNGNELRDHMCDKFLGGALKDRALTHVSDIVINEYDLQTLQAEIREILQPFKPASFHCLIPTYPWHAIVTTNLDLIVERAYDAAKSPLKTPVVFIKDTDRFDIKMKENYDSMAFLKLHGCIDHWADTTVPMILTTEQYVKYRESRRRLFSRLSDMGHEFTFIFFGYKINDPHIIEILFDLTDIGQTRPRYYVVDPGLTEYDERYWEQHRITVLPITFKKFMLALDQAIPPNVRAIAAAAPKGETSVSQHYHVSKITESPGLVSFVSNDVDHIRQGFESTKPEPKKFYSGYDEGWGPIEESLDITRGITDTIIADAVLVDERDRHPECDLYVLKGPAGNGKSVTLKRVAWETAHVFEQLVLFLREGGAIHLDALQEISDNTGKRIFLFVDKAALHTEEIKNVVEYSRKHNIKLTTITAERDNEWNIYCESLDKFVRSEYPIRYLSEAEIHRLLEALEKHQCLGELVEYEYEKRFEAFHQRAQRQLLVALHETTLGRPFEEIVYDEYERIIPEEAKYLYLDICTLNRLGVAVRAGLISRISGIRFDDFKEQFLDPLEHVVRVYLDRYLGDHLYSARHPDVAEMVFNQVLTDPEEKYDQLIRVMGAMNIDYSSDATAFRKLIRAKGVVEAFPSLELGQRFYRAASEITGPNPHVFHQEAQFELYHKGGNLSRAIALLNKAYELAPHDRAIQHSVANVKRRQALEVNTPLEKTKLRADAKRILKSLMVRAEDQSYSSHTVAQIALDELREILEFNSEEASEKNQPIVDRQILDLIRTVEQTISIGLQKFPRDDRLLLLEADFRELINQHNRAEMALQSAFASNPRNEYVAARLARQLGKRGELDKARSILIKCLEVNPTAKMIHLRLARYYIEQNTESSDMILNHLRKSTTQGDSYFEAQYWLARQLFLQGFIGEAMSMFERLGTIFLPPKKRNTIRGIVKDQKGPKKFVGKVVSKEDVYCFIECSNFKENIYCHSSQVSEADWDVIVRGGTVSFELGFSMRGPAAQNLKPA